MGKTTAKKKSAKANAKAKRAKQKPSIEEAIPELRNQRIQVEYVGPETLLFADYNPRIMDDEARKRLGDGIEEFGMVIPILARREDRLILGGHQRTRHALDHGIAEVPVIFLVGISDRRAKALNVLLNNENAMGRYDYEKLKPILTEMISEPLDGLPTFEPTVTGFDREQITDILDGRYDDDIEEGSGESGANDSAPPLPKKAITQLGDVITLGAHRLICGDSTKPDVLATLLGTTQVDLVVTDPPYGVDIQERDMAQAEVRGRRKDGKGVLNDELTGAKLGEFLARAFKAAFDVSRPGACWYVFAASGVDYRWSLNALADLDVARHGLIWLKDRFVMGRADYHYRHENIIYGWTPGGAHHAVPDRTQDSVWECARPSRSDEHPTMKPLALIERAIKNSSMRGDTVLDSFSGSGTTILACEATGRVGRGVELSPEYCDVIVTRWETMTGKTATRPER